MFKFSIVDFLKNCLIILPFIKFLSKFNHKTGILNNYAIVKQRILELTDIISINRIYPSSILEVGPGQTYDLISGLAKNLRISNVYALDVRRYFSDDFWLSHGVSFLYKRTDLLQDSSLDFIYCYDVLEHVKNPLELLFEFRRLISKSGLVFISWDLRDHLHLNSEANWFDMHKYSNFAWSIQMSHRSSYVNRLQYNDWLKIFKLSNFKITILEVLNSTIASKNFFDLYGFHVDPTYRVKAILSPI